MLDSVTITDVIFQALDAFHEAVTMFDEHIELHKSLQDSAFPHEKRSLKDNFEIIHKRLKMLHDKQVGICSAFPSFHFL